MNPKDESNMLGSTCSLTVKFYISGRHDPRSCGRGLCLPFSYYGAQDAVHSGQLKTLTAPGGLQTAYEYDGFLLTGTQWSGPVSGALGYEYNHYFEPTRQLLNGVAVDWQFNADSQLIQAGDLSLNYGPTHGLLTSTQLGSLYTGQAYNALGELSEYSASQYGSVLYHYTLHRDDVGRINGKTETLGGIPAEYQYLYDQHNRLAQVLKNGISVQSWQYDSNGNRTHENGSLVARYNPQVPKNTRIMLFLKANNASTILKAIIFVQQVSS
ncbi:hypothetical protein ACFOSD_04325 [Salinispirillum marinum]|uniref:Teneurin-like YD-shell domain-containing protein n=2 Tax=Saccharospirillaceae TaxID=255527 RepID=A0ABV8BCQ9_9GAMM